MLEPRNNHGYCGQLHAFLSAEGMISQYSTAVVPSPKKPVSLQTGEKNCFEISADYNTTKGDDMTTDVMTSTAILTNNRVIHNMKKTSLKVRGVYPYNYITVEKSSKD